MNRRAWFCYELNFANRPTPVIYYDDPPPRMFPKEATPRRLQVVEISDLSPEPDGEHSFAVLQKLYPLSKVLQKETSDAIVQSKEKQMARPVTGYQTSQGNFFETEEEANLFEATYELDMVTTASVRKQFGDETTQEHVEVISTGLRSFIENNEKVIREFLDARAAFTQAQRTEAAPMDRPSTEDNSSDDPQLRSEDNPRLEDTTTAEEKSPRSGKKLAS